MSGGVNNSGTTEREPVSLRMALARSLARRKAGARGFTLLELMIVISVMMILMAVAIPFYQQHVIQAREAVLRENLSVLNKVIEAYRMDKRESPQSLDDLVSAGYFRQLPVDPMTGKADWYPKRRIPRMRWIRNNRAFCAYTPLRLEPRLTARPTTPGENVSDDLKALPQSDSIAQGRRFHADRADRRHERHRHFAFDCGSHLQPFYSCGSRKIAAVRSYVTA